MEVYSILMLILAVCCIQGNCEEVCYDDVGCFNDNTCHSYGFPPDPPELVNVRFFLFTRRNQYTEQELIRNDIDGLRASNFDPRKKTKITIHGYTSRALTSGGLDRKDAFLEMEDLNVILVDWERGAAGLYGKSHQNTRLVGREIALLARFLNLESGMFYKDVHLIGTSLGAHVAGYAGEYQPGLGRITGLDPAGPLYRDEGPECHLDQSDAIFVDVIHTDGNDVTGLGMLTPVGHQDFYPNGGRKQVACDGPDLLTGCSHSMASRYFTESIRSTTCEFTAYPCESWARYLTGFCGNCLARGCAIMGYHADTNMAVRGKFYLTTNDERPYCQN